MLGIFNFRKALPPLFWHTDIHSHLCPGIDDGSPSPQTSILLLKEMAALGFTKMVITPHVTDETFPNTPDIIRQSFGTLTQAAEQAHINIQLRCSAEYRIDELLYSMIDNNTVSPIPGGWLLVENSWYQEPFNLDTFLFDLRSRHALKPILAHPERYGYYQRHPERLEQLHAAGIALQTNLLSLAGHYGKQARRTAEWLLNNNMISFIGSDLHRQAHIDVIKDYLRSRAYTKLENRANNILNDTIGNAFQ